MTRRGLWRALTGGLLLGATGAATELEKVPCIGYLSTIRYRGADGQWRRLGSIKKLTIGFKSNRGDWPVDSHRTIRKHLEA